MLYTMYTTLAQSTGAPQQPGIWAALASRSDPAEFMPCAIGDIAEEQVREDGQEWTVMRSPRGSYLRLTPEQRLLWHRMDGTHTVGQLATEGFLEFKQLLPVGDLVAALYADGFLTERPVGINRLLAEQLEATTAEGWGRRALRFLTGQRFEIKNIDGIYTAVYRWVGWLFFTPIFLGIWLVVALSGFAAFIRLLVVPEAGGAATGGVVAQAAWLWVALLTSFLLHESAHALAVKHFRRMLRGGGAMLYFGAPAFYVDTSDIWRSPRPARMLVSAAGPMSDLFIGGLAAAYALARPETALAAIAVKLALTCYIATLFNANPLLELDGYYILVDYLRLPELRRRALAFVRGPLWSKLSARRRTTDDGRPTPERDANHRLSFVRRPEQSVQLPTSSTFNREERIFTLYGALTLVYTLVAIVFAFQFWRRWLFGSIERLWAAGGWLNQVAAAALVLLVAVPLALGLGFVVLGLVRSTVAWLIHHGYGRRPALVASLLAAATVALALAFGGGPGAGYSQLIPATLWAVAAVALFVIRPDYRGAAIAPALSASFCATFLAGSASLLRLAFPTSWAWQLADGLALLLLLLATFSAQLDVNLRMVPVQVQLSTAFLLILAFGTGGLVLAGQLQTAQPLPTALLIAAPAYFGTVALALLLPYLFSLADSRLIWSWGIVWAAASCQTLAYVVDLRLPSLGLDVLAAGLWAAAWLTHLATLRQIAPSELPWPNAESLSESQRLQRAFQLCYAGCYQLLRTVYGARRTSELDDRIDVVAATANWDVRIDRELAEVGPRLAAQPLDFQGARFAEVLRYTVATIEDLAGATFAQRTIQAAYDALPWPERETAGRLCFPDTPWAKSLSAGFGDARAARMRLLRDADALLDCDDATLAALASNAHEQVIRAGCVLLRAGETSPGAWIIDAGEILVQRDGAIVAELHRAAMFGFAQAAATSYRASVDSTVLFVAAANLPIALREAPQPQAHSAASTVHLLERVPMFAQLSRSTLRGLAQISQAHHFAPREVVIRQGVASGTFFVIEQGRAAVLIREDGAANTSETRPIRMVARLGPEEFFGELELLDGTPPRAHVIAETALTVLALPHEAIRSLLLSDSTANNSLRQIGSGRLRNIRPPS